MPDPLSNSEALENILGTPSRLKTLQSHMDREHTGENLTFLIAVATYRKDANKKEAIAIIDNFVEDTAKLQINLDASTATALRKSKALMAEDRARASTMGFFARHWTAGDRKAASGLFDDAVIVIKQLIVRDVMLRFRQSATGAAMFEAMERERNKSQAIERALLDVGLG